MGKENPITATFSCLSLNCGHREAKNHVSQIFLTRESDYASSTSMYLCKICKGEGKQR